jgi:hypothetical protein
MDYDVDFSSLMSQQVANLDLMVGSPHIHSRINLWPDDLRVNHKIILWVEENSHAMLFCQQSLLQLQSHFLSHILIGSIYLCYVDFSLVVFGNGIRANDWWCRDETESLLWCTHGWAARHALVSRLIVVIHYETILMYYLLWTFSQSDRCILSRYVAIFYPIYLQYLVRYPLMNLHLSSVWELHASPPLKILIRISGWDSFKGEGCDTLDVYFVLCREIYPNLGCSVKISISRSHLPPFIKLLMKVSPSLELFDLINNQIWNLLKLFVSWSKHKFESQSHLATPVQTHLFGVSIVVMLSNRCPNPLSR